MILETIINCNSNISTNLRIFFEKQTILLIIYSDKPRKKKIYLKIITEISAKILLKIIYKNCLNQKNKIPLPKYLQTPQKSTYSNEFIYKIASKR